MTVIECHQRRSGSGSRAAHFIHCNLATGRAWDLLAAELAGDLSICAVDMLGQGRSAMPDRLKDYQQQCADASIKVLEVDNKGPQDLIGHSFGGCVALRVATDRPDLVRTLVLFEPVFFGFLADIGSPMFDLIANSDGGMYDDLQAGKTLDAAEKFLTRWGMPGEWERMPADQKQSFADRMWLIEAQRGSIIDDNDWRLRLPDLAKISCPALIMHGGKSPPVMAELSRIISATIPKAEADSIAKAGHMLPITHASNCADRLRQFWALSPNIKP